MEEATPRAASVVASPAEKAPARTSRLVSVVPLPPPLLLLLLLLLLAVLPSAAAACSAAPPLPSLLPPFCAAPLPDELLPALATLLLLVAEDE